MTSETTKTLNQEASDKSIARIKELMADRILQSDIVRILNQEGLTTIKEQPWTDVNLRQVLWKLRWDSASWYGLSARRAGLTLNAGVAGC